MKRLVSLVILICMLTAVVPWVSAETVTWGALTFDTETGTITACDQEAKGELIIPSEINGIAVTSIGYQAFNHCTELKSITIPDSVTDINDNAFWVCSALESIIIPNSVTYIGNSVFAECSALESVTIPDGITAIGYSMFAGCAELKSIYIPNSITYIGNDAFLGCASLKNILIPDSVLEIGQSSFLRCALLESIDVDENNIQYSSINGVLFDKDKSLLIQYPEGKKDVSYAVIEGVTEIAEYAFANCTLVKYITMPDSVIKIGIGTFENCTSLKNITLSNAITEICDYTFADCILLENIAIPDKVTQIGSGVFYNCESLKRIFIPDSVILIEKGCFYGCIQLENIDMGSNNINYSSVDGVLFNKSKSILIKYPACKRDKSFSMPDSVIKIDSYAFEGCEYLTDLYFSGTKKQWDNIEISIYGNEPLTNATIHFMGEPTIRITQSSNKAEIINKENEHLQVTVIIARYNGDGILSGIISDDTGFAANETKQFDIDAHTKIFLWDSLSAMKPLITE